MIDSAEKNLVTLAGGVQERGEAADMFTIFYEGAKKTSVFTAANGPQPLRSVL